MKKALCCIACVALMLVCGCNGEKSRTLGVTLAEYQALENVLPAAEPAATPLQPRQLPEEMDCIFINDKIGSRYYGVKAAWPPPGGESLIHTEMLVETSPHKEIPFENPEGLSDWTHSSSSQVILNGSLYRWLVYGNNSGAKLVRTDMTAGKSAVIDSSETYTPTVCPQPVDYTHFLSFDIIRSDGNALTLATLYGTNGSKKEIIREVSSSTGRLLDGFAVVDGEIYGFGRQRHDGQNVFYLYHYDRDGKLLDTQTVPGMEQVLLDETPVEFHLLNDYIVIRSYQTSKVYIVKRTGDGLQYLAKKVFYSILNTPSNAYIFLMEGTVKNDNTIKDKDCPLYIINTKTDAVACYPLDIPLDAPYTVEMKVTTDGELVLSYCDAKYDPLKVKKFQIEKDELQRLLP